MNRLLERALEFSDKSEYFGGGSKPYQSVLYTIGFPMLARVEKELYDIPQESMTSQDRRRKRAAHFLDTTSLVVSLISPLANPLLGLAVIALRFGAYNSLAHHAFDLNQRRPQNP